MASKPTALRTGGAQSWQDDPRARSNGVGAAQGSLPPLQTNPSVAHQITIEGRPGATHLPANNRADLRTKALTGYTVFADESGTHAGYSCYGIGALVVPTSKVAGFNEYLRKKKEAHGFRSEAKWDQVRQGHGMINFAIELMKDLLRSSARFSIIVIKKSSYRNWQIDEEQAFYKSYTMLMKRRATAKPGKYEIFIDDRDDAYPKQTEVMEIVSNRMMRLVPATTTSPTTTITKVAKVDSKLEFGIQAVDLLTGAVTAAHELYLNPTTPMNPGKRLLLQRLSECLGWDALHFDTMPESDFNIWHFPPEEWRSKPATKMVQPKPGVCFVTPAELATAWKAPRLRR